MSTIIFTSLIFSTMVTAFTMPLICRRIRDLQARRDQALLACKRARMRQELVQYVSDHRQHAMSVR